MTEQEQEQEEQELGILGVGCGEKYSEVALEKLNAACGFPPNNPTLLAVHSWPKYQGTAKHILEVGCCCNPLDYDTESCNRFISS